MEIHRGPNLESWIAGGARLWNKRLSTNKNPTKQDVEYKNDGVIVGIQRAEALPLVPKVKEVIVARQIQDCIVQSLAIDLSF